MKRLSFALAPFALGVFLLAAAPGSAAAQGGPACDKGCLNIVDEDTGETIGHACLSGQGEAVDCVAITENCYEITCRLVQATDDAGMPSAIVDPCDEDGAADVRILDLRGVADLRGVVVAVEIDRDHDGL